MSASYIGSTSGTEQAAFVPGASPKTVNLATPGSAAVGDFLVCYVVWDKNGTNTMSISGSGWTDKLDGLGGTIPSSSTSVNHRVFTKFIEAGATGTTYTLTYTCSTGTMGPLLPFLLLYRGLSLTSTFQAMNVAGSLDNITDPSNTTSTVLTKTATAHALGAVPLLLISCYSEENGASIATSSSVDGALTQRITGSGSLHAFRFYDEIWNSASDFPSRALTWNRSPTARGVNTVTRLTPTSPQTDARNDSWG